MWKTEVLKNSWMWYQIFIFFQPKLWLLSDIAIFTLLKSPVMIINDHFIYI